MEDMSTYSIGIFIIAISLLAVAIVTIVLYVVNKNKKRWALKKYQKKVSEPRQVVTTPKIAEEKSDKISTGSKQEHENTSISAEKPKVLEMSGRPQNRDTNVKEENSPNWSLRDKKSRLVVMPENQRFMKYTSEGYKPAKGDKEFEKALWN